MAKIATEQANDPGLRAALTGAGLPTADLDAPGRLFFRMDTAGAPAAYGGLEVYGAHGLLRSLVVAADRRGRGQGREMAEALINEARARGLTRLWLLTTTAPDFFAKLGFQRAERGSAPAAIAASTEFASLCPASAVCMTLAL